MYLRDEATCCPCVGSVFGAEYWLGQSCEFLIFILFYFILAYLGVSTGHGILYNTPRSWWGNSGIDVTHEHDRNHNNNPPYI